MKILICRERHVATKRFVSEDLNHDGLSVDHSGDIFWGVPNDASAS